MTDVPTWVPIHSYSSFNFQTLQLARTTLEGEGIPCFVPDENMMAINPMLGGALQDLRLHVPDTEADRARDILKRAPLPPQDQPEASVQEAAKSDGLRCPGCGSTDTLLRRKPGRMTWLGFLFFGLPFLFYSKKLYCFSCRNYHEPLQKTPRSS